MVKESEYTGMIGDSCLSYDWLIYEVKRNRKSEMADLMHR